MYSTQSCSSYGRYTAYTLYMHGERETERKKDREMHMDVDMRVDVVVDNIDARRYTVYEVVCCFVA